MCGMPAISKKYFLLEWVKLRSPSTCLMKYDWPFIFMSANQRRFQYPLEKPRSRTLMLTEIQISALITALNPLPMKIT